MTVIECNTGKWHTSHTMSPIQLSGENYRQALLGAIWDNAQQALVLSNHSLVLSERIPGRLSQIGTNLINRSTNIGVIYPQSLDDEQGDTYYSGPRIEIRRKTNGAKRHNFTGVLGSISLVHLETFDDSDSVKFCGRTILEERLEFTRHPNGFLEVDRIMNNGEVAPQQVMLKSLWLQDKLGLRRPDNMELADLNDALGSRIADLRASRHADSLAFWKRAVHGLLHPPLTRFMKM
jgi:hypothetical protein